MPCGVPRATEPRPRRDLRSLWLHSQAPALPALGDSSLRWPGRASRAAGHLPPSPPCSVRERCLEEQKRRRQRATKKISTFIGTFLVCFAPYVITR